MSVLRYAFLALAAIISLSALLAMSSAAPTIGTISCVLTGTQISPGDCIASAIPLALLGILLSLIFGAIIFMFGEVLNYRSLKNMYQRELWETLKSAIIVAIIFSSLVIASAIATSLTGSGNAQLPGPGNPATGTQLSSNLDGLYTAVNSTYLQPQLSNSYNAFGAVVGLAIGTDLLRSVSISVYFPIPIPTPIGIIGSVQSGVETDIFESRFIDSLSKSATAYDSSLSLVSITATYVTIILLLFQFQGDLIFIIAAVGLGVFIPIGIFLRSIPFIRGIGGTMIAIGIGISIIYPALLLGFNLPITNYMFAVTGAAPTNQACPFSSTAASLLCQIVWSPISAIGLLATAGGAPMKLAFGSAASASTGVVLQGFQVGVGGPFYGGIFPALNFIIDHSLDQIVQFMLFIFDIIIAYAITNGIANILGGRVTLGVGRFKLA
jgi:hypothetical protein